MKAVLMLVGYLLGLFVCWQLYVDPAEAGWAQCQVIADEALTIAEYCVETLTACDGVQQ